MTHTTPARAYDAETERLATTAHRHCDPGFAAKIRERRAEKRPPTTNYAPPIYEEGYVPTDSLHDDLED